MGDDADSTGEPRDEHYGATGEADATSRRRFLGTLSGPPIAVALAGCPLDGDQGDAGRTRTARSKVDLREMGTGDAADFRRIVRFADAYEIAATYETDDGTQFEASGRFDGGNQYGRTTIGDTAHESYVVDGDVYHVRDGGCSRYPDAAAGATAKPPADDAEAAAASPALTRTGTTTIDGTEVATLELPAGELEGYDEPLTYYVAVETGYLRRLDGGFGVVDFTGWGEVDPIEPPAECSTVQ